MPVQSQVGVPSIIEQGNAYIFTESFPNYPVTSWKLQLVLNSPALKTPPAFDATIVGTIFQFTLASADTSLLTPAGSYTWSEYATEIGGSQQRATAATGILQVLQDLSKPHVPTYSETMVATLETAMMALASGVNQSINFAGQSFTKKDLSKLNEIYTGWLAQVAREQRIEAAYRGNIKSGMIVTRFVPSAFVDTP